MQTVSKSRACDDFNSGKGCCVFGVFRNIQQKHKIKTQIKTRLLPNEWKARSIEGGLGRSGVGWAVEGVEWGEVMLSGVQ
jgi:hypothetical protein